MSSRLTARRYAKALLQIGDKQGNVPQLQQELESVAAAVAANADLSRLVASPLVLPTKKAEVFETILVAAKVSETLRHFFRVVAEAGRLNLLPELRRTFADLVDERAGIVEAKVSSAQSLTEAQEKALVASLAVRTGKTIRLSWHQDASLLGGVKVQVGSTVLDASLQGQLRQLKTQLLSA
ncbi:ATP synthase F1 subunit delta [Geothrix sp. PMB-07]|uniref:ATP synthase F1 subunit delta n=1 Tax=Geothrix sp. PMB-07 TaxID=3068640 RepID=UPI0027417E0E|nr:ATP synthase F1 subunit delta [Geothrix sp. PMB-07]WLT31169.1 ATP synthase F1 subunit delta [Geothrix sp. PMB-07]